MATTIQEPRRADQDRTPSGNNGWRNLVPADGGGTQVGFEYSPSPASTGIWVILFAITMMFAAFSSALFVRKGASQDWRSFTLPSILYVNTLVLLASSVTLEVSRRRVAAFMSDRRSQAEIPARWLYVTFFLSLLFVAGQFVAWQRLRSQGLYLATNPSSSFFYLLTAAHALHVFGGLTGMVYVLRKLDTSTLKRSTLDATARYWHFMGGLWLYLLLLLWTKI
jgi:cytochrome c oxidase subunit 3